MRILNNSNKPTKDILPPESFNSSLSQEKLASSRISQHDFQGSSSELHIILPSPLKDVFSNLDIDLSRTSLSKAFEIIRFQKGLSDNINGDKLDEKKVSLSKPLVQKPPEQGIFSEKKKRNNDPKSQTTKHSPNRNKSRHNKRDSNPIQGKSPKRRSSRGTSPRRRSDMKGCNKSKRWRSQRSEGGHHNHQKKSAIWIPDTCVLSDKTLVSSLLTAIKEGTICTDKLHLGFSYAVINELDPLKNGDSIECRSVRKIMRLIDGLHGEPNFYQERKRDFDWKGDFLNLHLNDSRIIRFCDALKGSHGYERVILCSQDVNLRNRARTFDIEAQTVKESIQMWEEE